MTLASFLLVIAGQRITLPNRLLMRESLGVSQLGGIIRLNRNLVLTFLAIQAIGTALLFPRFNSLTVDGESLFEWPQALWQSAFHAVSSFNGGGFTILPDSTSVSLFSGDFYALSIMAVLIILGGLSFFVILEMVRVRRLSRFSLDVRIVLLLSLVLWALGTLVVFIFEYGNEATLGNMAVGEKVMNAFFQSVSTRSAGLVTLDFVSLQQATSFFIIGLMFIGAASASTGGGIRLNTLGVIMGTVLSSIRGRDHVVLFRREVPQDQVQRALAVGVLALAMVFFIAFLLAFTEKADFLLVFFETVSAFGTVGMSEGITPQLTIIGKLFIIFAMLMGRLGPITLVLALTLGERKPLYRFAQERVKIG